jgi:hypothetical protein
LTKTARKPEFPGRGIEKVLLLVFIIHAPALLFPDEDANRLLYLLDDVLRAASEIENPLPPPRPDSPGFYLLNKTGFTLRELYVRRAGETGWGSNLIQSPCFKGQTVFIPFEFPPDTQEPYSVRVVDADGDYYSKYDITIDMFATVEMAISDYGQ